MAGKGFFGGLSSGESANGLDDFLKEDTVLSKKPDLKSDEDSFINLERTPEPTALRAGVKVTDFADSVVDSYISGSASTYEMIKEKFISGFSAIYIQTLEDERVDILLEKLKKDVSLNKVLEWNLGYGWVRFDDKKPVLNDLDGVNTGLEFSLLSLIDESNLDATVILIKGAKSALENNNLAVARLKQLLNRIERQHAGRCTVILVSEAPFIPPSLESQIALLSLPLPDRSEINEWLNGFSRKNKLDFSGHRDQLASILSGLTDREIRQTLSLVFSGQIRVENRHIDKLLKEKEQIITKTNVLEMVRSDVDLEGVGGLENLKDWLQQRAKVFNNLESAVLKGVQAPKGVLIVGMPGCGKSLTAKVTASLFKLPLLRLDIGSLLGKYVGESEHNMRKALNMAETVSPCILWIDELEKAFVGMGSANASEVTSRLLGYFLTWMQEKTKAVFVIATANDITMLPPELLRKGRFDEVFYVGFPNAKERKSILSIYLGKYKNTAFDFDKLTVLCRDYTGADIQNAISEAVTKAFVDGTDLTHDRLCASISSTVSLRETLKEKIITYEEMFDKLKLRPASVSEGDTIAVMLKKANDPNPMDRESVAKNPDCPDDILEKLASDTEKSVLMAVYNNQNCPTAVLSKRINIDKNDDLYDHDLLLAAIMSKNAPDDLVAKKIDSSDISLSDSEGKLLIVKRGVVDKKPLSNLLQMSLLNKDDCLSGVLSISGATESALDWIFNSDGDNLFGLIMSPFVSAGFKRKLGFSPKVKSLLADEDSSGPVSSLLIVSNVFSKAELKELCPDYFSNGLKAFELLSDPFKKKSVLEKINKACLADADKSFYEILDEAVPEFVYRETCRLSKSCEDDRRVIDALSKNFDFEPYNNFFAIMGALQHNISL